MHRSSESIGALAAALAKAQRELTNPEKSLTATIRSPFASEGDRIFRYASLASGVDIVRKCLGQHEIATLQTTTIDQDTGHIRLTTILAHASGEWISSDWPVCPVSETANPHRMGAALTYARRYALFALVGIAGEDDLDAPDLLTEPSPAVATDRSHGVPNGGKPRTGSVAKPRQPKTILAVESSAALRDQLIAEIGDLEDGESLALWAHRRLPAKNTLTADDARAVEVAYESVLNTSDQRFRREPDDLSLQAIPNAELPLIDLHAAISTPPENEHTNPAANGSTTAGDQHMANKPRTAVPLIKTVRKRSKAHLAFVAAQPCIVCRRSPCDAHHLKVAQPRSLGRKVSDEFTVPLCRDHHIQLHRHGNEAAWWANLKIAPQELAKELWNATLRQAGSSF
jgi:hypothetical protein